MTADRPPAHCRRDSRIRLKRRARVVFSVTTLIVVVSIPAVLPRSWAQTGTPRPPEAQQAPDTRQRIRLTPAERDALLAQMRTMLESLSGIMQGLVAGDLVMAQKAARTAGATMAGNPNLERKLPPDFLQLGMRTHKRFDGLADAIKTGATRDALLKRLAAITASCVTCHATYRLDETRE
jgi:hypothetical protein